jgi:hypothetical protein
MGNVYYYPNTGTKAARIYTDYNEANDDYLVTLR